LATYELIASPDTVHWGFYSAALPPILTIASGDQLRVHTESGFLGAMDMVSSRVSKELLSITENLRKGEGGHMLIGPVAVEGAEPGDVLEVRFIEAVPRYDWGVNIFRPLRGGLPEDFPYHHAVVVEIDAVAGVCDWGAGVKVPLDPFFGNFGVSPPVSMGEVASAPPGVWGGNLDNKELRPGTTVYFPVFNEGAMFSIGDGHGCQGDGESCTSALECALSGRVELHLRKDMKLSHPRAESNTHHIFMGFDPLIDNAAKSALRETISFLEESRGMSRDDAYTLCSLAVDLHVTQIVNGIKGVHAMLPKAILA